MYKGPKVDGLTQSILNDYIGCPFAAYLKLILGLQDEEGDITNLIWGDSFHKGLELLIPNQDMPKMDALKIANKGMLEHLKDNYPGAPSSFQYSLPKMLFCYDLSPFEGDWVTEEIIDELIDVDGHLIRFRGKRDARTDNHPQYGKVLGEHKCKGYTDPALCSEELNQDFQINLYMKLAGIEWVFYDLIKIPDVQKYGPQPKYGESPEEFVERIYHGPIGKYGGMYPIYGQKKQWIHQKAYYIPEEQQELYWEFTLIPIVKRFCQWYEWVTQTGFDHENPKYYNEIFYRMPVRRFDGRITEKFKCPYHSFLTGQTSLNDLVPITSHFSELEDL